MSGDHSAIPLNRGSTYNAQPNITTTTSSFAMPLPNTINNINNLNNVQTHTSQYPGINSIPGMQSLNQLNPMSSMTSFGLPSMNGISNITPFSNMHTMSNTHALLHPQQPDSIHPFSIAPISTNLSTSTNTTPGILHGGVDKKRRTRTRRTLPYNSIIGTGTYTTGTTGTIPGTGTDPVFMASHHPTTHINNPHDPNSIHQQTPIYEADGIQFKVLEQLPDTKIQRLRTEKIKPIENLTFEDIKAYNRNQLRAYCSVYGIRRKKKADMERDMARYASLFHPGDPAYDISKFEPTEYADGPIPRRKVPVTKEQKEQAAGDFKRLTEALHQRPKATSLTNHHYTTVDTTAHHTNLTASLHHGLPHTSALTSPRFHDFHTTPHSTVHTTHHPSNSTSAVAAAAAAAVHQPHHPDEHDGGMGNSVNELMPVPDMHSHLLSIPQQIGEE